MNEVILRIAAAEAESAIMALGDDADLESRFRAAAASTKHNWMAPDEDTAFRAAIAALYISAPEEDQPRILEEAEALKIISAMLSGIPVDLDAVKMPENPIGLMKLWRETP